MGSILDLGTKIPHVALHGQRKKNLNKCYFPFFLRLSQSHMSCSLVHGILMGQAHTLTGV